MDSYNLELSLGSTDVKAVITIQAVDYEIAQKVGDVFCNNMGSEKVYHEKMGDEITTHWSCIVELVT